jgi:hypothetical protein
VFGFIYSNKCSLIITHRASFDHSHSIVMFSFRRKPKKAPDTPSIRTSPSLPELNSQGILHWPADLVDIAAIQQNPQADVVPPQRPQSATKISFQREQGHISFHKPFRPSTEKANDGTRKPVPKIPPSAFDKTVRPLSVARFSQRRARIPPTFNLMVSFFVACAFHYHDHLRDSFRSLAGRARERLLFFVSC